MSRSRIASPTARVGEPVTDVSPKGTETILPVEDQTPVRKLAVRLLEQSGFSVLDARDASEALVSRGGFRQNAPAFLHKPFTSGTLAQKIRAVRAQSSSSGGA